jgi:hypothetical protein
MRILFSGKDGGPESTVSGFWLIEAKRLISVAFVLFRNGSREAFHSHAFNSISWVLRGRLDEHNLGGTINRYFPSWRPIITRRDTFHKVVSTGNTLVFTIRGPWARTWREYLPGSDSFVTLTNGRRLVD